MEGGWHIEITLPYLKKIKSWRGSEYSLACKGSGVDKGFWYWKSNCILKYGEVGISNQMLRKWKQTNMFWLYCVNSNYEGCWQCFVACNKVLLWLPWERKEMTKRIHDYMCQSQKWHFLEFDMDLNHLLRTPKLWSTKIQSSGSTNPSLAQHATPIKTAGLLLH